MDYLDKKQFRDKYCLDNSVKNFIVSCEMDKQLNKAPKHLVKSNNKVKDLAPSDTAEQVKDGFVQFVNDAMSVKRQEVLDIDMKDLMNMKIKLRDQDLRSKDNKEKRETFAEMVKRCYEHPEKAKTFDIDIAEAELNED